MNISVPAQVMSFSMCLPDVSAHRIDCFTPQRRHTSSTAAPTSACCRTNAVCCLVRFDFFIGYDTSSMAYRNRKVLTKTSPRLWELNSFREGASY